MARITKSYGNVFHDLNLENPEELSAKAELTRQVYNIVKKRRLTQAAAAELTGLRQPDVSKLMSGKFTGFSTDRLIELLMALGQDIEILVKPKPARREMAQVRVKAA